MGSAVWFSRFSLQLIRQNGNGSYFPLRRTSWRLKASFIVAPTQRDLPRTRTPARDRRSLAERAFPDTLALLSLDSIGVMNVGDGGIWFGFRRD